MGLLFLVRGVWGNEELIYNPSLINPSQIFESSHERAPFVNMISLLSNHTSSLSPEFANFAAPDVGIYHGKLYSYFPPGVTAWITPFFLLGKPYNLGQLFSYASIGLFGLGSEILIFLIARQIFKINFSYSLLSAFIFQFASTSLSYSITIYQHAPSTFLMLLAFYSVWRYRQHQYWGILWGFLVWLAYGLAIFFDYSNAIILLPILVYFLIQSISIKNYNQFYKISFHLAILITFSLFLLLTLAHLIYNESTYGSWRVFSNLLPRYDGIKVDLQNLSQIEQLGQHKSKALFSENYFINGIYELTIAPDKGILVFSPIFAVALLGIISQINKYNLEKNILLSVIIVNFFLYSSFPDPYGGWAFGPRYLIPSMAFLSIFVGLWVNRYHRYLVLKKVLIFLLTVVSSAIALLGALSSNQIPPKFEADFLHSSYGLSFAWSLFQQGKTGNFFYNNLLFQYFSLNQFYLFLISFFTLVIFLLLFITPLFEKENNQ